MNVASGLQTRLREMTELTTKREILFVAVGLAVGAGVVLLLSRGPSTYEQCMLDNMRGQPSGAYMVAYRLCNQLPTKSGGRAPLPGK
jgi:hypothetical protein